MSLLLQYTLIFASVLILVALGGCFSEHSGVINLGLEGIMIMGALGGALTMRYLGENSSHFVTILAVVLVSAAVGMVYSCLLSVACINFKADQTLVGTALNLLGTAAAVGMWWSDTAARILDPYLVVLNALPKTALGPIFIVWMGAGMGAIVTMTLAISLIVTILSMYAGFRTTDPEKLRLMRTLGARQRQILWLLVFPANCPTLFSTLKVNVGLSWVGVIMGEFLVSRAGLGYLIVYGSQVFNMDLVMASVLALGAAAVGMYLLVLRAEKFLNSVWGVRV